MSIKIKNAFNLKNVLFIDLRTKTEYNESHIKNALNYPILNFDEREIVSKLYKNKKINKAYEMAYDYSLSKLTGLMEIIKNTNKKIIFYCFKGRSRSQIVYNVFKSLKGKEINYLKGGYKSYRNLVNNFYQNDLDKFNFITLHGYSGSGKTHFLKHVSNENPVINFADIAKNTGSYFGDIIYSSSNVSQKRFEDIIFNKLYFSKEKKFYLESESKRIGNIFIRDDLFNAMYNGKHYLIKSNLNQRAKRIYKDYIERNDKFSKKIIIDKLNYFTKKFGNKKIEYLKKSIYKDEYMEVIKFLLNNYYDPLYKKSIEKYKPYDKVINRRDLCNILK